MKNLLVLVDAVNYWVHGQHPPMGVALEAILEYAYSSIGSKKPLRKNSFRQILVQRGRWELSNRMFTR
jgi:hypothetical protein